VYASLHIVFRKIIASLLLVLFAFIYAEKIFHIHQREAIHASQKEIAVNSISANCIICDFKIAKDSELPALIATNIPFTCWSKESTISSSLYIYLPVNKISNRGPPVI